MRNAQITIKMELLGKQAWDDNHETIGVYADADTPHEALSAALYQLLGAFQQQGHKLPGFGCRNHRSEPSAVGLTEEQRQEVRKQRQAEQAQRERELWEEFDQQNAGEEDVPEEE